MVVRRQLRPTHANGVGFLEKQVGECSGLRKLVCVTSLWNRRRSGFAIGNLVNTEALQFRVEQNSFRARVAQLALGKSFVFCRSWIRAGVWEWIPNCSLIKWFDVIQL